MAALRTIETVVGAAVMLAVLADIFLTILYARADRTLFSRAVARGTWRVFRAASRGQGQRRPVILSFCGPAILVVLVLVWALSLTLGSALVIHPRLGQSIRVDGEPTPTDFMSAVYAGGNSLTFVGAGSFRPHTAGTRLFFLLNSLIGIAVTSLTLTYLMQVYGALVRRNALGLSLDLASGESADAAELLAGMAPEGQISGGYTNFSELAAQLTALKETHHLYPVLFFFRFTDSCYSVSRITLLIFDTVSLIKTALSDAKHSWVKESLAVTQAWRAAILILGMMEETFGPRAEDARRKEPSPGIETERQWRARYETALRRLREAHVDTVEDERAGADAYVALRAEWSPIIERLAPAMGYSIGDIDLPAADPASADRRPEFQARLRSAG
jgi:hypothetical protein